MTMSWVYVKRPKWCPEPPFSAALPPVLRRVSKFDEREQKASRRRAREAGPVGDLGQRHRRVLRVERRNHTEPFFE